MTFNQQEQNQINYLIQQLFTSNDKLIIKKAVETLGNTGADNADVLEALIHLVSSTNDEPTRWIVIQTLGKIGSKNDAVLKFLIELLSNARIPTNRIIAQALLKFTFNIEYLITTLSNLAINTLNSSAREAIAYVLGQIGEGYKEAEDTLMYLISISLNEYDTLRTSILSLRKINAYNQKSQEMLLQFYQQTTDAHTHRMLYHELFGSANFSKCLTDYEQKTNYSK